MAKNNKEKISAPNKPQTEKTPEMNNSGDVADLPEKPVEDADVSPAQPACDVVTVLPSSEKEAAVPVDSKKDEKESIRNKIIIAIIDTVIIGGFIALMGQQFTSLKKYENVKFEKVKSECLTPDCKTARQKFYIYRLGETSIKNVSFNLKIKKPDYHIIEGSQAVKQSEKSLFLPSNDQSVDGSKIDYGDPDLNNLNSYGFKLNELSPNWIYTFQYDVFSRGENSFSQYEIFQIVDDANVRYPHQNLNFYDLLRLYLIETLVVSILAAILLWFIFWFLGKYFFISRRKGSLNR